MMDSKTLRKKTFRKLSCASANKENVSSGTGVPATDNVKDSAESGESTSEEFDWEANTYAFNHAKRGLAIIINNEDFSQADGFDKRPGSTYDAKALCRSFCFLGFDVVPFDNLYAWQIEMTLESAACEYDHKNADCFACAILTHGSQSLDADGRLDLLYGTDGRSISTKNVVEIFNDENCPNLLDKPRMFFFQACRGENYDHGQTVLVKKPDPTHSTHPRSCGQKLDARDALVEGDSKSERPKAPAAASRGKSQSSSFDPPGHPKTDAMAIPGGGEASGDNDDEVVGKRQDYSHSDAKGEAEQGDHSDTSRSLLSVAPLYKDCLIMYATPPGYFAWRRNTGAWFIQSLCKILPEMYKKSKTLMWALTWVAGKTAAYQSNIPDQPEMDMKKEAPVVETMLVKDVIFHNKTKDNRD